MEKTKLGLSVGVMGALIYFTALFGMTPLLLAAGYVLIRETDEWLHKCALRALVLVIAVKLLGVLFGFGDTFFGMLNGAFGHYPFNLHLDYPLNIDGIILGIAGIAENVLLVILGIMALSKKGIALPGIDTLTDKALGIWKPKAIQPPAAAQQPYAQQPVYPPQPTAANAPQAPYYPPAGQPVPPAQPAMQPPVQQPGTSQPPYTGQNPHQPQG